MKKHSHNLTNNRRISYYSRQNVTGLILCTPIQLNHTIVKMFDYLFEKLKKRLTRHYFMLNYYNNYTIVSFLGTNNFEYFDRLQFTIFVSYLNLPELAKYYYRSILNKQHYAI